MHDPYSVLGVARNASDAEIKTAYRRLAKRLHPDLHPGETAAELRFEDLQTAYNILKNPTLRRRYDRGVLDAQGNPKPSPFEEALKKAEADRAYAKAARAAAGPTAQTSPPPPPNDAKTTRAEASKPQKSERDTILSELLANLRRGRRPKSQPIGPIPLTVSFAEAVRGVRRTVSLPSGRQIAVTLPPGTENGQILRLRNVSAAAAGSNEKMGPNGKTGPDGKKAETEEISVEVTVTPDPRFVRDGLDLISSLPISLTEAVLGARIQIEAPGGAVKVTVPAGANSGTVLKLRGQGIRTAGGTAGDLKLELKIVLPPKIDSALENFVRDWSARHPYSARS